ncbi:hypothetical protein L1887_40178 [Cichorium endivia]|nr:hypothetical protein L1887_40178 [Cichorium endivia]
MFLILLMGVSFQWIIIYQITHNLLPLHLILIFLQRRLVEGQRKGRETTKIISRQSMSVCRNYELIV